MKLTRLLTVLLAGTLALGGLCKDEPRPPRRWQPGFFEPLPGRMWSWPAGLAVERICGAYDEIPASELPLELAVRNYNARRVDVKMPAGLVFSPFNSEYQHMMLLQKFHFSLPEGDTVVHLPTYCANEDLDEPDDESFYEVALQVWELELGELFDIVEPKLLEGNAVDLAQDALFEITEGGSLTDSTRAKLAALPDR